MTHFCAFVFTSERLDQAALEQLLWPWSVYNLESAHRRRFDYFEIGGRFCYPLDASASSTDPDPLLNLSQKQKRSLATDALRERAVSDAAREYDEVHTNLAGRLLPDIAELKRAHGEREWAKHFHDDAAVRAVKKSGSFFSPWHLSAMASPREVVLARAAERAMVPCAIVSNGVWHAFDEACFDEDQTKTRAWCDLFAEIFASAEPDSWLTVVDCHF